jgi:hypothetical protein
MPALALDPFAGYAPDAAALHGGGDLPDSWLLDDIPMMPAPSLEEQVFFGFGVPAAAVRARPRPAARAARCAAVRPRARARRSAARARRQHARQSHTGKEKEVAVHVAARAARVCARPRA